MDSTQQLYEPVRHFVNHTTLQHGSAQISTTWSYVVSLVKGFKHVNIYYQMKECHDKYHLGRTAVHN